MKKTESKTQKRVRRHARIRARIVGTSSCPRLAVFKSNCALYAQVIDDERAVTLLATDSRSAAGKTARERAVEIGGVLGAQAKKKGIERVVFDRGGFQYEGIIAAFADSVRTAGLVF